MAYELPEDLIRQVKMATRAEAGLTDYDLTHDLLPLPSLSEAVAAFDPSPPYLRCKNCNGRLLRGVQSLLCIYCGRSNDVPPDPISFRDTFAYHWLLGSLHLDGSELVGLTTEKNELSRGQDMPKDAIPLSDFLNLKVVWSTEVKKKETASNKKTEDRSYLSLTGLDLDNFFSGSEMLNTSGTPEEHSHKCNHVEAAEVRESITHNDLSFFQNAVPSNSAIHSSESKNGAKTSAKEVATHEDFNLWQNVQPSEIPARTPNDNDADGNSFSGWEATFQSADPGDHLDKSKTFAPFVTSGNQGDGSKSSDPSSGSTVDLSSQLDSVFGHREEVKDGSTQTGTAASPSAGDWNDDLWNNLSSKVSQQTGQSDSTFGITDAVPQQPQGLDWFEVGEGQSNNVNAPSNNLASEDVYEWNDFESLTSVNVSSSENFAIQNQNQLISTSAKASDFNLFTTDNKFEEMDFGSFSQADPFPSSLSKENALAEMYDIGLEVSSSDRVVDIESDTGPWPAELVRGDVNTAGSQQIDVEKVSPMHDLSFMLENTLSLPPKSNDLHS
ncbi:hypothetical protein M9H77_23523 [Catharanthus roseus]|uniref:Uncharacterized protein n=1 Tax=Catharanthus roseus TaxID=4058 RepID=A0ACC0AV25_CATRO|nr:hypothetical protein M9H77_23523 [Catharanthus roseus]